jgi:PASTA domain/NPCBM/NEW2 domain
MTVSSSETEGTRRPQGRLRRAAIALGAVTVLIWAIVFGWFLNDWFGDDEEVVAVDRPVRVYAPEAVVAGQVPNVIGLSEEEARRVFSDAGIDLNTVSTHTVPYVGPTDLVVRQSPASGSSIEDDPIVLDVSESARMPDLTGEGEGEAKASLSTLGARTSVVSQYQPGATEGEVLSTDPPSGETIVDKATLHVAEPLSSIFLTELSPVESSCRAGEEGVVAGETQTEAIVCQPEAGANARAATYVLGGQVEALHAVIGLDDRGASTVPVEFRVYVDGEPTLTKRLDFGESMPIEVPLLGKFQLRLEAAAAGVSSAGSPPVKAVFGEPRLVGSRSAIDLLAEGLGE